MIVPTILCTLKGKLLLGLAALSTTVAITEVLLGQLITAIPPTLMVGIALITLMRGQKQMLVALDGKLDALMDAKIAASRSAGKEEERVENRARLGEAAIAKQSEVAMPVEIVGNTEANPLSVKPVKPLE